MIDSGRARGVFHVAVLKVVAVQHALDVPGLLHRGEVSFQVALDLDVREES